MSQDHGLNVGAKNFSPALVFSPPSLLKEGLGVVGKKLHPDQAELPITSLCNNFFNDGAMLHLTRRAKAG